jgi:hypothetical protein
MITVSQSAQPVVNAFLAMGMKLNMTEPALGIGLLTVACIDFEHVAETWGELIARLGDDRRAVSLAEVVEVSRAARGYSMVFLCIPAVDSR